MTPCIKVFLMEVFTLCVCEREGGREEEKGRKSGGEREIAEQHLLNMSSLFPGFSYEKDAQLYFDDTCVVPERMEGKGTLSGGGL